MSQRRATRQNTDPARHAASSADVRPGAAVSSRVHRLGRLVLLPALALMGSAAATAQTAAPVPAPAPAPAAAAPDPAPQKIDKVIVTASPFANQDELQATQPGVILGREALTRDRAASLGDTLSTVAGVQSSSFGPGASRPIIRGLDGPRVKTAENGVGTLDVATISPDHAVSTETLGVRQIEVLRGPATLLYGSGAIGGLVNLVSDRIPQDHSDGTRLLLDTRLSSAERARDVGTQLRTSLGPLAFTGEYADRATSDLATAHAGRLANSDTQTKSGSLGSSYILDNGFIGLGVNRFESNYGIPSPDASRIDMARNRIESQGEWNATADAGAIERLRFNVAHNDYRHAEIESNGQTGTVFRNRASSGRVDLQTRPVASWRTVFGADFERSHFSAVGEETIVPPTASRSSALFAVSERSFAIGRIELGGRVERVSHAPDSASTLPARDFTLGNGSIAWQWQTSSQSMLTATFTHAERAPAIEELYSKGAHVATLTYDIGNPALSKERSQNFDLSWKLQGPLWSAQISAFRNSVKNFIYGASVDGNGDGIADRVNDAGAIVPGAELLKREFRNVDARFTGAEATLAYAPARGLGFSSSFDTVRAIMVGDTNSGNLPRTSPTRLGAKATWRGGADAAWYGELGATHVFDQNRVASFETATPGYTRIDASLRYRWSFANGRRADFYLLGKNLSNRDMRVHTSFLKDFAPLPGRSVFIGVTARY